MVIYSSVTMLVCENIVAVLSILSIWILRHRRIEMAMPILLVSIVVFLGSLIGPGHWIVFLAWFGFVSAYISGQYISKIHIPLSLFLVFIEIAAVIASSGRPKYFVSPGEYGAIGLMSIGILPLPLSILAVLISGSRSAWVGLASAAAIKYLPKWAMIIVIALSVVLIFIRVDTVLRRVIVWNEGIHLFLTNPIFGHGAGSYRLLAVFQPGTQHADNIILTILIEFGLVGAAAFGYLAWEIFKQFRNNQSMLKWGLVAVLIMQMVDASLYFIPSAVLFGICLAQIVYDFPKSVWWRDYETI
jgi:hypothetical protein